MFSNAALHWMPRPAEVVGRVRPPWRPGGRFVAELGGAGNIDAILEALGTAMTEAGLPAPACPWYFPTLGQYATLLEAGGFRVARMEHFPRPTPLAGGDAALADWLAMFGGQLTAAVPRPGSPRWWPGRRRWPRPGCAATASGSPTTGGCGSWPSPAPGHLRGRGPLSCTGRWPRTGTDNRWRSSSRRRTRARQPSRGCASSC